MKKQHMTFLFIGGALALMYLLKKNQGTAMGGGKIVGNLQPMPAGNSPATASSAPVILPGTMHPAFVVPDTFTGGTQPWPAMPGFAV